MNDVMLYKDFIGSVHYSGDDETFYGKLHGIADLLTFEGSSVSELETPKRLFTFQASTHESHVKHSLLWRIIGTVLFVVQM